MNIYQPYTYLITFKLTGERYYGVRYKQGCNPSDLWSTYYTSSKRVKQLLAQHGADAFSVEIRRTFTDKQSALLWEHTVLRRLNAAQHSGYLNENNGNKQFFGGGVPKGFKHTEEARRKMSENSKGHRNGKFGKPLSQETKRKLSEARKGYKESAEVIEAKRKRMSGKNNPNYGKKFHWYNNGETSKLVEQCPGPEWVRGRLWSPGHREKMEKARWNK